MYKITFKKSALKELSSLPVFAVKNLKEAIDKLSEDPRPPGSKKMVDSKENLWRIRSGNYRVLYTIDDDIKIVEIRKVGDRKDIYK